MKLIFLSSVLLFLSTAYANERENQPEDKNDAVAYESFNSPIFGGPRAPGKGYPLPATPALPAGYALPAPYTTYLNSLGSYAASPYGYGNPYNRYSMMPYSAPYYGYGGYGANVAPYAGYGYPAGVAYGNLLGRSAAAYNGYPGYAGPGYRFGGLGYNAGALRGPAVPVAGVPAPVAAGIPAYAAPVVPVPGKGNALQYGYAPPAAQKLPVY